jgi:nitrous oxidase accessory protein NosD
MRKNYAKELFFCICMFFALNANIHAITVSVDCDSGDSLSDAITAATPGTTLSVSGTCHESINITTNNLTLTGNESGIRATLSGSHFVLPQSLFVIDGALRVIISGFNLHNGLFGIFAKNNASVSVTNTDAIDNIIGVHVLANSHVNLQDVNMIGTEGTGKIRIAQVM